MDGGYNITFTVNDSSGNVATGFFAFNVSDGTAPNNGTITETGTTTSGTITATGVNESVNATMIAINGSSFTTVRSTTFDTSKTLSVPGLDTVTDDTIHFYNLTLCDFNGNCISRAASFTQTATVAVADTPTAGTGTGGGG